MKISMSNSRFNSLNANNVDDIDELGQVASSKSEFKLTSINAVSERTIVDVHGVKIGGAPLAIIAGPCSVESREQLWSVARYVAESGVRLLRAGAFKPRTSPYAFQGMGVEALELLKLVKLEFNLGIVTEATEVSNFDIVEQVADLVQIGARNMQNFALLKRAGRSDKPILLKRGPSATLEEWLFAAEYILLHGNNNVVMCERGIRTWSLHARNTLDVSVIPALKRITHLPVIADPSHATGCRALVIPCARAAVAALADGLIIETHNAPDQALSDGKQALLPSDFIKMLKQVNLIRDLLF